MKTLLATAALAALIASVPALAAPKGKASKKEFDKGVVAYQKGEFAAASEALGKSYKLEPDLETLFAWAQSERQQNKCDSAIDLYNKLLDMDMPAENKDAVRAKLDECKAIIKAKTLEDRAVDKPIDPPKQDPPPESASPPIDEVKPEPEPTGAKPWWKDPIGDALTFGGVVALGVGGYFLYSSKQADDKSHENDSIFEEQQDKAESHGKIGVALSITGGVLIVGGIVRYMTRSSGKTEKTESTNLTGWVTNDGGGFAAFGRF